MHSAASRPLAIARLRVVACAVLATACLGHGVVAAADDGVRVGLGTYYTKPKSGVLGGDATPPVPAYLTGEAAERAAPTSQWYSSAMYERWSSGLHTHPMTYKATAAGFEIGLPSKSVVTDGGSRELRYAHAAAIVVSPVAFKPQDAKLQNYSDWLARLSMADAAGQSLTATVLHGNPFSYYECSAGDVRFHLSERASVIADPRDGKHDPRVAAFTIAGHSYAVFAPTGASFDWSQPTDLVLHLPETKRYFSVAGLPDANPGTVADFLAYAYAFPTDTRADWSYDEAKSTVKTVFHVQTVAREGQNLTTFMGLYPHQWKAVTSPHASRYSYDSVRGTIRLIAGNSFTIERPFYGVMPMWGALEAPADKANVDSLLVGDLAKADQLFVKQGRGTYWIGKGVGAVAQLMSVAEAEGKTSMRNDLLGTLKSRLESWFDGKHSTYFAHDAKTGTLVGYPEEFGSISHMNDHHFHYGYWILGAAHVALRDPDWISDAKWGGMVKKLVADIATDERGRKDFPFLRNFDAYEGHSWASGDAAFDAGNNQESSSEAVNAWAGLVMLGEATGDRKLRDLGIYLYTSEVASVQQYWFDLDHQVLPAEFGKPMASMVFGGKVAYNTWWTQEPHEIIGINEMPFTPAETYLAADPQYIRNVIGTLPAEEKAYNQRGIRPHDLPQDIWQDVMAEYLALADADAALALWNRSGMVEFGETRSHTAYWILSLKEMGTPDFSVTADTVMYAVFKAKDGARTYLAYNARSTPLKVTFSDGKVLDVAPHSLARLRA